MALILAAPLAKGLLATAIRTAGSKAVQPYVTALVKEGAGRKAATQIAKEYVKTVGKSNKTGAFPLIDKAANKNITNALNNTQRSELQRKGLLASEAPAATISKQRMIGSKIKPTETLDLLRQNPTGQISGMPVYGTRTGGEITRIPLPQARITNQFPVPVGGVSPLEQIAARSALAKQRAGAAMINKPIVQTVDKGLTGLQTAGLLGGLTVAPMFFGGSNKPMSVTDNVPKQTTQTPQEDPIRFSQVLRPTSQATAKEVLNAALLRAGLTLTRGGSGAEAIESALTVGDTQTTFRSGKEALEAGQKALGKDAKISIYQRSDGTFGYQGTTAGATTTGLGNFFGTEGSLTEAQIKSYLEKAGGDTEKAKNLALADGFTEEQLGIE